MRRLACRKRFCILGFTRNPPCFVGWVLVHCPLYPRKQGWFRVFLRNQSEGFASIRTSRADRGRRAGGLVLPRMNGTIAAMRRPRMVTSYTIASGDGLLLVLHDDGDEMEY